MKKLKDGEIVIVAGNRWRVETLINLYSESVASLRTVKGEVYDTRPKAVREAEAKRPPWAGP